MLSGQAWYRLDAIRAVNQAIGRVIRHKDDYGAILLCDSRFKQNTANISKWIRDHLNEQSHGPNFVFETMVGQLANFFSVAKSQVFQNNISATTKMLSLAKTNCFAHILSYQNLNQN